MRNPSQDVIDTLLARRAFLLAFPAEVEDYFQQKVRNKHTQQILQASWAGVLAYLLYAICDYLLLPDIYRQVWFFRFFVALPLFVAACIVFPRIESYRWRELVFAGAVWLIGGATCWLVLQSRAPLAAQELAGFCLFIVFSNVIVRFRFTLALVVSGIFLCFFLFASLWADHIPVASHVNNFVLLFSTAVMSLIANYWLEMEERRNFLLMERDAARKHELQRANDRLEGLSYRDGLTSAYNKRYFDMTFPRILDNARRARTPVFVLYIDVDHFKAYNDNYGHMAGDRALVRVAQLLTANFRRRDDFVARTGGEEFIGVVAGSTLTHALELAEKIRRDVQAMGIPHEHSSASNVITVSVGIAGMSDGSPKGPQDLLNAADAALYQAKQSGRNRVVADQDLYGER